MNIGLLHYSVPPVVGGVESVLARHAVLMTEAGHKVRTIAGRGKQFDSRVAFHHIPFVDSLDDDVLLIKKELDRGTVSAGFDSLVSKITSSLDSVLDGLDLLIAHNVCSLHKNLALTAALRKRLDRTQTPAWILWHHDLAWTAQRYRKELHDGYPWDLIRQDWPGAKQVVVSEFRRNELAELLGKTPDQIRVIPNGVAVTELIGLNTQTTELISRLQMLKAFPLILLPVRITPRKNIEFALRIVAELKNHFPDVMLVITGPPGPHNIHNREYFDQLKSLRQQLSLMTHVHFLADVINDYLAEDVIYGFFRLADLLLLPSFEEGFGLPIIEASQVKLPIFCSNIDPLRELAGDGVNYFLPESDPKSVASMIRTYVNASGLLQTRMRLRRYDWDRIYEIEMEPLLWDAIGNR